MRVIAPGPRRSVVVANGTEGKPASRKDEVLLARSPHLVLDGVCIAADTVGAEEAVVCLDRDAAGAIRSAMTALEERQRVGLGWIPVRIETAPSAYVTGEESALTHWLTGGQAKPVCVHSHGGMALIRVLAVDPIACEGHGLGAELVPELITLDDWGCPIIDPRPIPGSRGPHLRRAVAACPTSALLVRKVDEATKRTWAASQP